MRTPSMSDPRMAFQVEAAIRAGRILGSSLPTMPPPYDDPQPTIRRRGGLRSEVVDRERPVGRP